MAFKLTWDETTKRLYETGVDRVVLYPQSNTGTYPKGVAWNGFTAFNLSPSGAEPTPLYANNGKYLNLMSAEEIGGTMEAYTYPDEWAACDGSATATEGVYVGQQPRKAFGLAVRTLIGNDTEMNKHGYKIHLIYGALATPSEKAYSTVNDSPEANTFSYEFSTTPVAVTGFEPTAYLCIDSTKFTTEDAKAKLAAFEQTLYGTAETGTEGTAVEATLPLPGAVIEALKVTKA